MMENDTILHARAVVIKCKRIPQLLKALLVCWMVGMGHAYNVDYL
jgi:hypothetical protein